MTGKQAALVFASFGAAPEQVTYLIDSMDSFLCICLAFRRARKLYAQQREAEQQHAEGCQAEGIQPHA